MDMITLNKWVHLGKRVQFNTNLVKKYGTLKYWILTQLFPALKVWLIIYCCMNLGLIYMNIASKQETEAFLTIWQNLIHIRGRSKVCQREGGVG